LLHVFVIDMSGHSCFTYYFCNLGALCALSSSLYSFFTFNFTSPDLKIPEVNNSHKKIDINKG